MPSKNPLPASSRTRSARSPGGPSRITTSTVYPASRAARVAPGSISRELTAVPAGSRNASRPVRRLRIARATRFGR
ncbi:hypothetical protein J3R03_003842 [Actinoplanes couchii]|nr:hypothetical protein [Actinoplanes couchii]MDR6319646.1 hypothetical protein [Actinoplanes couchii]